MIVMKKGDILSADAEALVNTVNCVGISGRGIALQFKRTFPENFKVYEAACKRGDVVPGRMCVFETGRLDNPRYIINFPTKRHWRGKSRMEDIERGLEDLVREVQQRRIRSIAVPPLGSGLGGLNWRDVRPRIETALSQLHDVDATVFEPSGTPEAVTKLTQAPKMTPGRAAIVGLMQRYLAGLMDPYISLLEVHKLMYFMQEAGEHLRLRYEKALYGPYAQNLRHQLLSIEGHFVSGYDGSDKPDTQLELVPGATEDAGRFIGEHPETRTRFDRVADLVEGFETPFGLELLASVHWVATQEKASSPEDASRLLYKWSSRKRQFTSRQIHIAWDILARKGWLAPTN